MRILFELGLLLLIGSAVYSIWKFIINYPTKKPEAKEKL